MSQCCPSDRLVVTDSTINIFWYIYNFLKEILSTMYKSYSFDNERQQTALQYAWLVAVVSLNVCNELQSTRLPTRRYSMILFSTNQSYVRIFPYFN